MLPADRRRRIHELLQRDGSVSVVAVRDQLNVSEATIRRDFIRMEKEGLLERTRGGSILTQRVITKSLCRDERHVNQQAKEAIGAAAAALPSDGDTVFVNGGSTNRQVLRHIFNEKSVRVVTSNASAILEYQSDSQLVITGGTYRSESCSFTGPEVHRAVSRVNGKFAFIGVEGLSVEWGLTTATQAESEAVRHMIQQTMGTVVVVADHSKIGVVAEFVGGSIEVVDVLVTDRELPGGFGSALSDFGIEVVIGQS